MARLNFDASQVDPSQTFDPVPVGWYVAQIIASELKPTSSGTGTYLELEMEIIDGEFRGRKLFDRLNLDNPNPVAVEIAQKKLSAVCHATGVIQVEDSTELHQKPLMAKVSVRPADGQYEAGNEVKGYKPTETTGGAGAAQQGAVGFQQGAGQNNAPAMNQNQPQFQHQPQFQQPVHQNQQQFQQSQDQGNTQPNWNATPDQQQNMGGNQTNGFQNNQQNWNQGGDQNTQGGNPAAGNGPSAGGQPGQAPWNQQ